MKSKKEKQDDAKKDKQNKEQKKKKQDLKKLTKDKNEDNKTSSSSSAPKEISKDKMSDAEEAKWLKQLNLQKNTYLYKLNTKQSKEKNSDEKPW